VIPLQALDRPMRFRGDGAGPPRLGGLAISALRSRGYSPREVFEAPLSRISPFGGAMP